MPELRRRPPLPGAPSSGWRSRPSRSASWCSSPQGPGPRGGSAGDDLPCGRATGHQATIAMPRHLDDDLDDHPEASPRARGGSAAASPCRRPRRKRAARGTHRAARRDHHEPDHHDDTGTPSATTPTSRASNGERLTWPSGESGFTASSLRPDAPTPRRGAQGSARPASAPGSSWSNAYGAAAGDRRPWRPAHLSTEAEEGRHARPWAGLPDAYRARSVLEPARGSHRTG